MSLLRKIIYLLLLIISFACKTKLEKQGWQRIDVVTGETLTSRKDKEVVVIKKLNGGSYFYQFYFFKKDSSGKIPQPPFQGLMRPFNSDFAYYKWESDSVCLVKLLNQGNVQASFKYVEYSDSLSSFETLKDLK